MRFYKVLKWIRVVIALIFFFSLLFVFIDFAGLMPVWAINALTYLQFTPSLLLFLNITAWAAAGFIFVIIFTLLFGRIYCSTICPLGTLQDILIRIEKKFKINKRFTFYRSYKILHYSLLFVCIIVLISGSAVLFSWLDPYSDFGKISNALIRPVYIGLNNLGANILNQFDNYSLYHVSYKTFQIWPFVFAMILLIALIRLTMLKGRLFCNTVCPVGALLGIISRFSMFRPGIEKSACTSCWVCSMNCKAGCIDAGEMKIDASRCVGCFDCMIACPKSGLKYKFAWKKNTALRKDKPEKTNTDSGKRNFLLTTALFTFGLNKLLRAQHEIEPEKESTVPENREHAVMPPGAQSFDHFNRFCTSCHLCVSACPTQVIQVSFLKYGILGMFQPYMEYHKSFCNFECTICTEVCPSGALLKLPLETKQLTQLGVVEFIKENCIVETEGTDCGACSEHCPTKAVYMIPYKGLFLPEVNQDICIGCGACEYACPVVPYKAIYVNGNTRQVLAEKPPKKEIIREEQEDFPF